LRLKQHRGNDTAIRVFYSP